MALQILNQYTMKANLIATIILSFGLCGASYAQDTIAEKVPAHFKHEKGMLSASLGVTGLLGNISLSAPLGPNNSPQVFLRYFLSDNLALRMGLAPSIRHAKVSRVDSVGKDLVEFDSTNSRASFDIMAGIEYHFEGTKRLDPYIGIDLSFGLVGTEKFNSSLDISDTTGTATMTRTITQDGGYSFGARAFIGANYYVSKHFYLGVGYGLGFTSVATGGDRQEVIQNKPVSGSETTTRILGSARNTTTSLDVDGMAVIQVGFLFGGRDH